MHHPYQRTQTPDIYTIPKVSFFVEMNKKLEELSHLLPFVEFKQLFENVFKKAIKKFETTLSNHQTSSIQAIQYLNAWLQQYGATSELQIRLLILESLALYRQSPQQSLGKLNKVKHLMVETKFQYLLPKVFFIESKIYESLQQIELRHKSLKKSIQYGENYVVEFLKESNQIRLELADYMIISYFQMYKYTKAETPESYDTLIHCLTKAYKAALKNYGSRHFSTNSLLEALEQQKKLLMSINRLQQPKPITQVCMGMIKKSMSLQILYNWEEEALIMLIKKSKSHKSREKGISGFEKEERVVSENQIQIKMDMNCIKALKNTPFDEYLEIGSNYQIIILQEELNNIITKNYTSQHNISINHNQSQAQRKINVSMLKPFTREQLAKGDTQRLSSSSSDDEDLLGHKPLPFNNFLYYNSNPNVGHTSMSRNPPSISHSRSKSKDIKGSNKL